MLNLRNRRNRFRLISKAPKGSQQYRPSERYYGIIFEFNPYDDDDHPSVPHGDSLDHRFKIDLRNGDVYVGRKQVSHLKRKDFERLKRDKRIKDIICIAQVYYREHHPEIKFDPIPWCEKKTLHRVVNRKRKSPIIYKLRVEFNSTELSDLRVSP